MKNARIVLFGLLMIALFQVSCKKDEEKSNPVYRQPSAASRTEVVSIPAGLETKANAGDLGATLAVTYMGLANAISSFGTSFTVPSGAKIQNKKSSSTVYYWSYGGYSYWMTYAELLDKYSWKYEWEFPGQSRFTYISAEEGKTGKNGSWTIFDPDLPTSYVWTYDWSINASNAFIASLEWNDGAESHSSFDVIANANNSGSFKFYDASVLSAEILWNADGSGTYWIAGDGNGMEGSWTAK
jgi:hypothetical protein